MAALLIFLGVLALCVAAGIVSARDPRPDQRPPSWSIGRLIG